MYFRVGVRRRVGFETGKRFEFQFAYVYWNIQYSWSKNKNPYTPTTTSSVFFALARILVVIVAWHFFNVQLLNYYMRKNEPRGGNDNSNVIDFSISLYDSFPSTVAFSFGILTLHYKRVIFRV